MEMLNLIAPSYMVLDKKDNIFVSDRDNHRIQVFNDEGQFLHKWGEKGNGDGQFNYPLGITLNNQGNIIVADQ